MQQLIHVKIGLTDGVYPVRKFYTEGVFKDIYEFQENANTIAWVHKRWCTPVDPQQSDTDWRGFLRTHWDATHNHCQVEHLDEFYAIFRRAAAAYINKQNHEQDKDKSYHQHGAHEPRRTDALLHQSGRQRPVASLPAGDKAKVRETNRQMKPVELSLFPDL